MNRNSKPDMARRSDKSAKNTNIGCIWGLISMFNFRQNSSKLLTERRSRNRKRIGSWYNRAKVKLLTEAAPKHEHLEHYHQGEEKRHRQSIKKLMEKEMRDAKKVKQASNNDCGAVMISDPVSMNNKNNIKRHQTSDVIDVIYPDELKDTSLTELVDRISNNIFSVLEDLNKKDKRMQTCPEREVYHKNENAEPCTLVDQTDSASFQDHFILQVLESLIYDDISIAKQIISQSIPSQTEEVRNSMEVLGSNKELLLKVLQDTKPSLLRQIQNRQGGLRRRAHKEQSGKRIGNSGTMEYDGCSRQIEGIDIHEPLLKERSLVSKPSAEDDSQSCDRIVILKPHSTLNVSNKTPPSEKERSMTPAFFQDIKRRLRQLMRNGRKDQLAASDGESHASEHDSELFSDSKREKTSLIPKGTHTADALEETTISSDIETFHTSEDAIFPRKPKIDFVDLLECSDVDHKLVVSKSSKTSVLLPEYNVSTSRDSLRKDKDPSVENIEFPCANEDTDVNFFRSSILNLENSTTTSSNSDAQLQMFNWRSQILAFQAQDTISTKETTTPKDFLSDEEGDFRFMEYANIPRNAISSADGDRSIGSSAECGGHRSYSQSNKTLDKTCSGMPGAQSYKCKALETADSKPEKSSPISVLEPIFLERFVSPGSMATKRAKNSVPSSRKTAFENSRFYVSAQVNMFNLDGRMRSCVNDDEFKYGYLRSLLEASCLCDSDNLENFLDPYQLLDPVLYDEVETPCEEIPDDLRLFFDSINEVLVEIYEGSSSSMPWVSFYKHGVWPFPSGENLVKEAWRQLNCVFVPHLPMTLDEIVEQDFETRTWMDIRCGAEATGFDFGDAIMDSLLEEIIYELCGLAQYPSD